MAPSLTELAGRSLRGGDTDPVAWIADRLGETLWSRQREIARSVVEHRYTAVRSCYDTGKSFIAARLVAWWLSEHPVGSAVVVTSAPTHQQVRAILWKEIRRAYQRGNLVGRLNLTEWWIGGELVGMGRKPSDYDPAAFQGIHAPFVLVVFDEAAGIPASLWDAALGLVTTPEARFLAIGNPDDPQSEFARVCAPGSGWHTIGIGWEDTPNFTGEALPSSIAAQLISQVWVDERARDWGADDPRYVAKVLGKFPTDDSAGVVPWSAVTACQVEREWTPEELLLVELGVDVGAGGDLTVIRERRGPKVGRVWRLNTTDPMEVVGTVSRAIAETGASRVKIDVIGIGWAVAGRLAELGSEGSHGAEVVRVNVGTASTDPTRFPRLRDQLWWEVGRGLSVDGAWDLSGLDDETIGQLIAPRWRPDSAGRVKVEPKDETRKRLGRSPDDADALLLAYYAPATVGVAVADEDRELADPYAAPRGGRIWG